MRIILFALAFLVTTSAFAQQTAPFTLKTPAPLIHINRVNLLNGCPVGLSAQRRGTPQTMWAIALEDSGNPKTEAAARAANTGVHVQLSTFRTSSIRQVELAVYFIAPGTHAMLIGDTMPPELKKTFNLAAEDGASLKLAGDLLVGPSAGITHVHILSIDYSDGTKWTAGNDNVCNVEPNGFMLLGASR